MNSRIGKWLLVLAVASFSSNVSAGYYCDDHVSDVASARGAEVYINSFAGSGWLGLCFMTATVGNVTVEQCKPV